jgi:hypothetical protein
MKIPGMARRTQVNQISLQSCLLSSQRLYMHVTAISVSFVYVRDVLECHMIMTSSCVTYMDYMCIGRPQAALMDWKHSIRVSSRAGPKYSNIRIFVRWVGIRFENVTFEYSSFFCTPGIPLETVLIRAWICFTL